MASRPAGYAWVFNNIDGTQYNVAQGAYPFFLAERRGDVTVVASVPEPQAVALTLTALGALVVARRRRRSASSPTS